MHRRVPLQQSPCAVARLVGLTAAALLWLAPSHAGAQNLVVDGTTITLGGIHAYDTVQVINGGKIVVPVFNGTDKVNTGNLQIRASSIFVDATSSIVADGAGYQPVLCDHGRGPNATAGGRGGCAVRDSGGGGAHFGAGGRGTKDCFIVAPAGTCQFPQEYEEDCGVRNGNSCTTIANCYDYDALPTVAGQPYSHSIYEIEFGAAGGDKGCRDGWDSCNVAGPGGGRIVLAAINAGGTGTLDIRGKVTADGWRGCGSGNDSAGGGAGGSLLLVGDQVHVTAGATVSAAGALGGDTNAKGDPNAHCPPCAQNPGGTCDDCGGGGGGGIISVLAGQPAVLESTASFNVSGALGGTCPICQGEAGGGAGELQLAGLYLGEFCDGYDNNFDGVVDENLGNTTCGTGACQSTVASCDTSTGLPNDCVPQANASCQPPLTDTRSRFMVIVDTSASMLTDLSGKPTFGDGSANHAGLDSNGDGLANDSRLYKAKQALTQVISAYPEIDFGLARFTQDVDTNVNCQLAHWFECAGICCSYDNPANNTGGTPPAGACTVNVGGTNYTVQPTSPGDECVNYAGKCGAPRRGADVLVGFEKPIGQSLMWLDHKETAFNKTTVEGEHCAYGAGGDCELRGTGPTPLAGSLYTAAAYLKKTRAEDRIATCRRYAVILLTDGAETCRGTPTAAATELLALGVETYVIGFSVLASEQASLNAIANAGSTSGTRNAFFVGDENQLAATIAAIVAQSVVFETCNDKDDDCDLLVDEDFPLKGQPCDNGLLGECFRTGTYVCKADGSGVECNAPKPTGTAEICDNKDNNCNGAIDEGIAGGCIPCVPQVEVCNGKDDNCDGNIDEGYVSVPCGSDIGECKKGTTACVNGAVVCQGGTSSSVELCDNKDNNCDTVVDAFSEACYAPPVLGALDYTSGCNKTTGVCTGQCQLGTRLCTNGSWGACSGAIGPIAEICNNKDDNCDGQIDEGVKNTCTNFSTCVSYQTCAACPLTPTEVCNLKDDDCDGTVDNIASQPCGTDAGECKKGVTACDATGAQICSGGVGPTAETCNNKDDDCNGKIDDNPSGVGGACGSAVGECKQGTYQCVNGKIECVGGIGPQPEICDGKDNNCDGTVDNGITATPCGSDVGECKAGTTVCSAGALTCQGAVGPSAELCDGKDNDCNGVADDNPTDAGQSCGSSVGECKPGVQKCISGALSCVGELGPKTELCDGKDNDCNGTIDDGVAGTGTSCGSDVGECKKGTLACQNTPSGWALVCTGAVGPAAEICDGKDNNCNGSIDEDFPEKGQTCGTNVGECQGGSWKCDAGNLICEGGTGPTPESCDGKDNDCNGAIDDNVAGDGQPCGSDVGECKKGTTKCVGAKFICVGGIQPAQEICDGKDNDCDGVADQNAACPGSSSCVEGQCVVPCGTGEFNCPGGTRCVNGYCIPDSCAGVTCSPSERCIDGKCVDKCASVTCAAHEKCNPKSGQCLDDSCLTKGCPSGKVCVGYECVDDPCPPGKCPTNQACIDGACVDSCLTVTCSKPGEVCVQGKCQEKPCENFDCPENQTCRLVDGQPRCEADPCAVISCAAGEVCREGKCLADPCATTQCPKYTRCEVTGSGEANCVLDEKNPPPGKRTLLAAGGGGCSCELASTGVGEGLSTLLLGAVLMLLWGFRRRRRATGRKGEVRR